MYLTAGRARTQTHDLFLSSYTHPELPSYFILYKSDHKEIEVKPKNPRVPTWLSELTSFCPAF